MTLEKTRASAPEAAKLIQEMQYLIETKGLDVKLNVGKAPTGLAESGCSGCTLCSCMICW